MKIFLARISNKDSSKLLGFIATDTNAKIESIQRSDDGPRATRMDPSGVDEQTETAAREAADSALEKDNAEFAESKSTSENLSQDDMPNVRDWAAAESQRQLEELQSRRDLFDHLESLFSGGIKVSLKLGSLGMLVSEIYKNFAG